MSGTSDAGYSSGPAIPPGFDPPSGFDSAWYMPEEPEPSPGESDPEPVLENNTQLRVVCWRIENTARLMPSKVSTPGGAIPCGNELVVQRSNAPRHV